MSAGAEVVAAIEARLLDPDFVRFLGIAGIHSVLSTGDRVVEVVYERHPYPFVLGLRIVVDPSRDPVNEAARILVANVGEPLGSLESQLVTDASGVHWWSGEPIEWWDDST